MGSGSSPRLRTSMVASNTGPDDAGFVGRLVLGYAAMPTFHAPIKCAICGNPISLEDAKVTENGKPVHEECYVAKLRLGKHDPQ